MLLPIVTIMVLVGLLRHYAAVMMKSELKTDDKQVRQKMLLQRARLLAGRLRTHVPGEPCWEPLGGGSSGVDRQPCLHAFLPQCSWQPAMNAHHAPPRRHPKSPWLQMVANLAY